MKNILTLAKWETRRLGTRFNGKSKYFVIPVVLLVVFLSYSIYHQDFTLCKGIYNIGVSANGPVIEDTRFNVTTMDPAVGSRLLKEKKIDLYVSSTEAAVRKDDRSQYAAGALQKYLEKQELARIAGQYSLNDAFPLRIKISYLDTLENNAGVSMIQAAPVEMPPEVSPAQVPEKENYGMPAASLAPAPGAVAGQEIQVNGIVSGKADSGETSLAADSAPEAASNPAVQQQLENIRSTSKIPEFKAEFVSENDIIVPSLMNPPMPLAQVIIAFLYVIPIFFVSVFFTSSFTEEKVNRKLVILLSTPVSRFEVILGKMLPYFIYSLVVIVGVTLFLHGNILIALSIFLPVMLFIFAIYLMVALTYRTFKDQTFFSVLALSVITVYLVVPAMFAGVSNLSFISPLTLAVTMFRGETFTINQYLIATIPLYLTFFLVMYVGTRVFNEEYLMGFKPLHIKAAEALYLTLNKKHINISIFLLSLLLIPLVFAIQLVAIVVVSNLPSMIIIWLVMLVSIVIEEVAKSAGIVVLIHKNGAGTRRGIFKLAFLSALGFWTGEKILLLLTINLSSESKMVSSFFGAGIFNGWLLIVPLVLHIVSTYIVCLMARRGSKRYPLAIICGTVIHAIYNISILFFSGVMQ
jgi:hypothetical protein